jgi:hypothetical protein
MKPSKPAQRGKLVQTDRRKRDTSPPQSSERPSTESGPLRPRDLRDIRVNRDNQLFGVIRTGFWCLTFGVVAWFGQSAINAIAGKSTDFTAVVRALVDLKANEWFAYALATFCGGGWYRERKLRHRTIQEQGAHIAQLERRIDPKRRSSGLLSDGRQRKEDRDE